MGLLEADKVFRKADALAHAALKKHFKEGRSVRWRHGDHIRSGVVLSVSPAWQGYDSASLRIESSSGAVAWIGVARVLDYEWNG